MLNYVDLKCFKIHENKRVEFFKGMQFLKAPNEGGKSSLIEGVAYNWFGSKALLSSLDRVITYGHEKRDMKTETGFTVQGQDYVCKRSASGAEITLNGEVKCTGQREVTTYIEALFGIPSGTAHMLLLARQNSIRGILEDGKSHEFIEKLADFKGVDNLVELLQNKLGTGAVGPAKLAVTTAQERFDKLDKPVAPVKETTTDLEEEVKSLNSDLTAASADILTQEAKLVKIINSNKRRAIIREKAAKAKASITALNKELKSLEASNITEEEVNKQVVVVEELDRKVNLRNAYLDFKLLPEYPEVSWEGDRVSFDTELANLQKLGDDKLEYVKSLRTELAVSKSKIITDKVCKTCGSEIKDADAINLAIEKEVDRLNKQIAAEIADHASIEEDISTMVALEDIDTAYKVFENSAMPNVITSDNQTVPVTLEWIGKEPEPITQEEYTIEADKLKDLEISIKIAKRDAKRRAEISTELAALAEEDLKFSSEDLTIIDTSEIDERLAKSRETAADIAKRIQVAKDRLNEINNKYKVAVGAYNAAVESYNLARKYVAEAKNSLKELEENNRLIKDVREARKEVTDHIWNLVLKSISNYFSKLRGASAVITKSDAGFMCDGELVSDLSGSTLDILGLAIRFALTKMFLPGVGLQILDEPGAGCDADRSRVMMGFISASGFNQNIIVTHRIDDEVAADNLIIL